MKWKDTVLNHAQLIRLKMVKGVNLVDAYEGAWEAYEKLAKAQAEISFKAGYEKRKKEVEMTTVSLAEMCHGWRKAGIKLVVDYLDSVFINSNCITLADIKPKLKEWGL